MSILFWRGLFHVELSRIVNIKNRKANHNAMSEKEEEDAPKDQVSVLKKKISYLEEELVRHHKIIEKLKEENLVLFKTALKNSNEKVASTATK